MVWSPARIVMPKNGSPRHVFTRITDTRASVGLPSHDGPCVTSPTYRSMRLNMPMPGSRIHCQATVLSTVAWQWILDPGMGMFNRILLYVGLVTQGPSWLGNPTLALVSVILVNTWRGLPFFGITILAGLQTIPTELMETATIDGASSWQRFRYVTLPLLMPVIFIVTTFSIIFTFFDFQLVYVLTGGGPANATHLMATYAYSISMGGGQMGLGSAAALAMVPMLGLVLVAMSSYVRKA